jgi:hypothetical protein
VSREEERGRLTALRLRLTVAWFDDESSDIISSSSSDDRDPVDIKGECGNTQVGRVGMETGSVGLEERFRC